MSSFCGMGRRRGLTCSENKQRGSRRTSRMKDGLPKERKVYTGMFQERSMDSDPYKNVAFRYNRGHESFNKNDNISIDTNARLVENNLIDEKFILETRPPKSVPSILESGPPPPPSNVQSKDGAYPCPYVQCYARRIQDKEVTIQTDCWERVLVSTWRRVKKPCKVRIPQYEPVCYSANQCPPKPTKQRLQYTTFSAPKAFDRNDDGILDAAEREQARAAGQLRVERRSYVDPREMNLVVRTPSQPTTIKTTYQAPKEYDINKDGVLDARERALAARDGKLEIIKKEIIPNPTKTHMQSTAERGRYPSPSVNNERILEVGKRQHARRYGDQIRNEKAY